MRWQGRPKSDNVEDRRNTSASGGGQGGGDGLLRLLPMAVKMLGVKGTVVAVLCLGAYGLFSGNLGTMLSLLQGGGPAGSTSQQPLLETEAERELADFVSVILADTEKTWTGLFAQQGKSYEKPRLVLFRDAVDSACGMADSAVGPFYCPADRQVYIDLGFFDQLQHRFNAPGDFAQAYVIAHEVGHHVQTLLGISGKVQAARKRLSATEGNKLLVQLELQADCFAGIWAHHANAGRQLLEAGDVEEGLAAASAVGDDTLQKQAKGHVTPDSFTHGSAAQRTEWFSTGLRSGDMDRCATFAKAL